MTDFNFEEMRYILSPLQVVEELDMPKDGLMVARVLEPTDPKFSVIGYDLMWNKEHMSLPTEKEHLKVVEIALGETSLDLTVALILEQDSADEITKMKAHTRAFEKEMREEWRARQLQDEQDILENKKSQERMSILQQARLNSDATELLRQEVMAEHPDLDFPDNPDTPQ